MVETQIDKQSGITSQRVKITIAKDSMTATMVLRQLKKDDAFISVDEVMDEIKKAEIVYGIDKNLIEKNVADQNYNQPIKIATGKIPKRGQAAIIECKFDTSENHKPTEDEHGGVDYKAINFIQNVSDGDVLAIKTPAKPGEVGLNVFGKEIQGPEGRDVPFKYGKNTSISDDGLQLVATSKGAIVFLNGKISINDVTVINGDVDFSVGNIESKGSIKISGGIKSGFTIHTDGDLEVAGNVEDCNIVCKGNIFIKGGLIGKGEGIIQADGDITVKFAESARLVAGGNVFAGDEIINCHITAKEKVIVKSRIGKITGGETNAGKEIRAAFIGSDAGTATLVRVAYDSELVDQHVATIKEIERLKDDSERIKEALVGLYRLQIDNKLSPQQEEVLKKFEGFQNDLPKSIEVQEENKAEIEESLQKLRDSKIVAEDTLYSGTKAYFGIVYREILEDSERCKLELDGTKIFLGEIRSD